MVGVIDEIRMPEGRSDAYPVLVDTKTRVTASLPPEWQRRNGRYSFVLNVERKETLIWCISEMKRDALYLTIFTISKCIYGYKI